MARTAKRQAEVDKWGREVAAAQHRQRKAQAEADPARYGGETAQERLQRIEHLRQSHDEALALRDAIDRQLHGGIRQQNPARPNKRHVFAQRVFDLAAPFGVSSSDLSILKRHVWLNMRSTEGADLAADAMVANGINGRTISIQDRNLSVLFP